MVNKKFEMVSGQSKEEIEQNLKFGSFISQGKKTSIGNGVDSDNYRFTNKDGQIRHVHLNVQKIPGSKQSIATINDITEIKRTENELKVRMNELERWHKLTVDRELKMIELKKRIRELETSLTRSDLKNSKKMAITG